MPLPVLPTPPQPASKAEVLRLFAQAQLEWCRPLGDEAALPVGYRIWNQQLPESVWANCLLGYQPSGETDLADADAAGQTPLRLVSPGPTAGDAAPFPGWFPRPFTVLKLDRLRSPPAPFPALTFLPARAAVGHFQKLVEEAGHDPVALLHLDDARYEPFVAMLDRKPVGTVGLQGNGAVGVVRELFVSPDCRGRGIGRALVDQALELAGRSGHRHVLTAVERRGDWFGKQGFEPIGTWTAFIRPGTAGY